jgi:kanamycin kinase
MSWLNGPPPADLEPPAPVRRLAAGHPVRGVWRNHLGGLTYAVGDPPERYVKWLSRDADPVLVPLAVEAERLGWAGRYTSVPEVLELGEDDVSTWMVTRALPGSSAVDERWKPDPTPAVRAVGTGLRALHDALPVDECPFDWSPEHRLAGLKAQFEHLRDQLAEPPPVDRLVVCHGDPCAPNTLVGDDGRWVGHVDLGSLGVADRWADLAVATMSLGWNFGPGWERELYEAYGVEPDPERTAHYRLLWDCT